MCFTSSDRTDDPPPRPARVLEQQATSMPTPSKASMPQNFAPPAGPPPSHRAGDEYAPPSGPPPSHDYAPPAGPPPTKNNPFFDGVAPPSGPPPSQRYGGQGSSDFAPPPGPPPSQEKETKKHDWETAVPDTSLLPPPPSFFSGFDRSPTNNAPEHEAREGEDWCRRFPLSNPLPVAPAELDAMNSGNINMFAPPFYRGTLGLQAIGVWRGKTESKARDTCLATYPPLYSVTAHSPFATHRAKTIYYEVRILEDSRHEVSLALGYVAPPYPPFRLPGWHRGSLAVHGDDGHKYINDRWGGKEFTHAFRRGETLGLGMEIAPAPGTGISVQIFLTRDGVENNRWDLHEETDKVQDLPVTGLEGFHDICAAIGVFDAVSFEIVFVPEKWRWQGWRAHQD